MAANIANLAWLILFLPLAAAVGITLLSLRKPAVSAGLSIAAIVIAFVASAVVFGVLPHEGSGLELNLNWLTVGSLKVDLGVRLDGLSELMLLIVTGVGSLIHIYSYGYMKGDRSF